MLHWVSSVVGLYTNPDATSQQVSQPTTATSRSPTPSSDRRRHSEGWILLHPNGELEVDDTGSLALSDNDQSHGDGESVFGYDNGAEFGDATVHQHDENMGVAESAVGENDVESFSTRSDDDEEEEEEVEAGDGHDHSTHTSPLKSSTTDHMIASADNLIIPLREPPLAFSVPQMPTAGLLPIMATPPPFAVAKITNHFVEYPPPEFPPTLFSVMPQAGTTTTTRFKSVGPTPYELHILVRKTIDRLSSPNTSVVKHPHPVLARLRNHEFMVRKLGRLDSRVGRAGVRSIGKRAGLGLGNKGSGPAIGRTTV